VYHGPVPTWTLRNSHSKIVKIHQLSTIRVLWASLYTYAGMQGQILLYQVKGTIMRRHNKNNLNSGLCPNRILKRTVTDLHEPKTTRTQLRDITRLRINLYIIIICCGVYNWYIIMSTNSPNIIIRLLKCIDFLWCALSTDEYAIEHFLIIRS